MSKNYKTGFIHMVKGFGRAGRPPGPNSTGVPERVLKERDARYQALRLRTLTQIVCGDPPPGYSALDAKQKQS